MGYNLNQVTSRVGVNMNKWLKRALIVIGILALVVFGGFNLHNVAYSKGEVAGYDAGYSLGQEEGYNQGKADGYEQGVQDSLGHDYTLRNPTYREAIAFMEKDKTDSNKYNEAAYACGHFARDICNNAEAEGLRCAAVILRYPDGDHVIIAFETIDEGLIYFEPQGDERVKPVIGERYYLCVEPKPGYYYEKPSYDDTIRDIIVIW